MFNLFDSFSAGLSLLFIVLLELIVVAWIYGEWRLLVVKTFYPGQCLKSVEQTDLGQLELLVFESIKWDKWYRLA